MHIEVLDASSKQPLQQLGAVYQTGEESRLYFHSSVPIDFILWNGQPLASQEDKRRLPYAHPEANRLHWMLHLTDYVGLNRFTVQCGQQQLEVLLQVYPSKLSGNPEESWRLLRLMAQRIPDLTRKLDFPLAIRHSLDRETEPALSQYSVQLLYNYYGGKLDVITRRILRAPDTRSHYQPSIERGGRMGGVILWEETFQHWTQAGTIGIEHISHLPQRHWDTGLNRLLLYFWQHLWQNAQKLAAPLGATEQQLSHKLHLRYQHYRHLLPGVDPRQPHSHLRVHTAAPAYHALLHLWQEYSQHSAQLSGLPQGTLGMAYIYEIWVACELAALLGCDQHSDFHERADGEISCTFRGEQYTIDYNLPYRYRGVGHDLSYESRPDLFVRSNDPAERIKFVADVKYRNLQKLDIHPLREVNQQLRGYMGDYYARVGLALWPGNRQSKPLDIDAHGLQRGSIGKLSFSPQDNPEIWRERLKAALSLSGMELI